MLSELEVGQFHAFGFVVIRNCLSVDEFEQVEKAYTRLIATAPQYTRFSEIGTHKTETFVFEDEILANFPDLQRADIRACLAFAADRERRRVSLPPTCGRG